DPDITPMSVARAFTYTAEELGGFVGLVTVISVGDGPTLRRLNIPLTLRGAEDMHLRHALIGHIDELALGPMYVYDGAPDQIRRAPWRSDVCSFRSDVGGPRVHLHRRGAGRLRRTRDRDLRR